MLGKIKRFVRKQLNKGLVESKHDKYVVSLMKKTGWGRRKASRKLYRAKHLYGIRYSDYIKEKCYTIPEKEYETTYGRKKMKLIPMERTYLEKTVEATGWTFDDAKKEMDRVQKLCDALYKDYYSYEFWKVDDEIKKTYFTIGHAHILQRKYNTSKKGIYIFTDKAAFAEVFEQYFGRVWLVNRDISLDEFKEKLKDETQIIYKPLKAYCGRGIKLIEINEANIESVYEELMGYPEGIIESVIVQHPLMAQFSTKSVNTIRIVSMCHKGDVEILYAGMRMGGKDAVVDNFHRGGVVALIDLKTGEINTDAVDLDGNVYETHPVTGKKVKGFVIPYWDEAMTMITEAAKVVPGVGYVGWDIAITEQGPMLVEGNTEPASVVLQMPYSHERKGMKHIVEKYL